MRRSRAATAAIAVVTAVVLTACGSKSDDASGASSTTTAKEQLTAKMTVGKIASLDGQFAQFLELAKVAGITADLDAKGPITVFAPNSESVVKLGKAKIDALKANKSGLKVILENHVVEGELTLADLAGMNGKTLEALSGKNLLVEVDGNVVTVGGAKVVKSNIDAENGAVFVVDGLVQPES